MSLVVSAVDSIDFYPDTVEDEIVQNVRTIVATTVGTVPLFRDFGIDSEAIDKPLPVARALVRSAVIDAVQKWEPRAVVDDVLWNEDDADAFSGVMRPVVTISLSDGVDGSAPTKKG